MKTFTLPSRIKGFIFDMDATLYTHDEYAEHQNRILVKRLAELRGMSYEAMREKIEAYRNDWAENHNGERLSMGNTMKAFGISIQENIHWREQLIEPDQFINRDPQLRIALTALQKNCKLAVVTNNPVSVAIKTLDILGVSDLFSSIIGLDTFKVSKPYAPSFLKAAEDMHVAAPGCTAVGDRYDIDIALPLKLGMGGILVNGAEDIYMMPEYLKTYIS